MKKEELNKLRNQLSIESKNGIDFIIAATIIWSAIAFIWTLKIDPYNKSVLVFILGAPLLPLAFLMSKILKTIWKIQDNPLQPLGIQLNIAQLFYFPFLIFILIKQPHYFIMTYTIITGAHFFPYSWFYRTNWYAIFVGLISLGSLLIALLIKKESHFLVGIWTAVCLLILTFGLVVDYNKKRIKMETNKTAFS